MADHIFLRSKNKGMSRCMRGNVLVEMVFVTDRQTDWVQDEKDQFYSVYKSAMEDLCKQAAAAGVKLSFSTVIGAFRYQGVMDPNAFSSVIVPQVQAQYLQEQGFSNHREFIVSRKQTCNADEVALMFVMEKHFRAFAMSSEDLEYCVLTESNDAHAISHELLHLFGAVDLYYPYHIYGLTMQYFPKTIMCTYEGQQVDPLTQYLIGWVDTLAPKAREFMDRVGAYSLGRYRHANILECYRGRDDELLQALTPYESTLDLIVKGAVDDPWAEFLLGLCYQEGIYFPRNLKDAEEHFARSGKTGLLISAAAHAQLLLCRGLRDSRDAEDLRLLLIYNSWGHMRFTTLRIACQLTGTGFPQNREEAIKIAISRYQDNEEAYLHYEKRSAKFYEIAEKLSSKMPELQAAVRKLREEYDTMLETDDPDLQYVIARLLLSGEGVERNPEGAFTLFHEAARKGNYLACRELARCCRQGIGTTRNTDLADQWEAYAEHCRKTNPLDAFCKVMESHG